MRLWVSLCVFFSRRCHSRYKQMVRGFDRSVLAHVWDFLFVQNYFPGCVAVADSMTLLHSYHSNSDSANGYNNNINVNVIWCDASAVLMHLSHFVCVHCARCLHFSSSIDYLLEFLFVYLNSAGLIYCIVSLKLRRKFIRLIWLILLALANDPIRLISNNRPDLDTAFKFELFSIVCSSKAQQKIRNEKMCNNLSVNFMALAGIHLFRTLNGQIR